MMSVENDEVTAEQSAEYLRLAVAQMSRHRIPTTPENYATWYAYVRGDNLELNNEIERLVDAGSPFTAQVNTRLHHEYVVEQDGGRIDKVRAALNDILGDVGLALQRAGGDAQRYGGALGGMIEQAAGRDRLDDIRELLETLVSETRHMQHATSDMQAHFEAKSKQIEELQEELQRERQRAVTDPLTGLYNRFALIDRLQMAIAEAAEDRPPSLIMLDIDHFKAVNDTQGHLIGDRVIRFVAQILRKNIKGRDTAARYGGEEFTVLLPSTDSAGAVVVAETIREAVSSAQLVRADTKQPLGQITISAGIATYADREDVMDFIDRADRALYRAKNEGRNRVCTT